MVNAPASRESASAELQALRAYALEARALGHTMALLGWDEKTMMPARGIESRALQRAVIAGVHHERSTSDELHRCISAVEERDPDNDEARVLRRDYELATKFPTEHVRDMAQAASLAGHAWQRARAANDFAGFSDHLDRLLELSRRTADYLGYDREPYDALVDIYEEGMTAAELAPLFASLREPIRELVAGLPEADASVLKRSYPVQAQQRYVAEIVGSMGYDLDAGRIDPTAHPFCITVGEGDVRLTTRYDENWLPAGLFATIHEAGHGIYNQAFQRLGIPVPLAEAPGLGMHESQSRMYENIVGRSLPFWEHHYEHLQRSFPEALRDVELSTFYRAINTAEPSLIRVEADELTYNLHIGLRFEIERELVNGDMHVRDLPAVWREQMLEWVGVEPDTDASGVLQDVHWSMGSFGYFPTYTLGNIYSAQFVEVARRDLGDLDRQLASGQVRPLRDWFDEHVYRHGRRYTGRQFVERVTGGPISVEPLVRYLREKFRS